ncbi:unnamed protein product [Choristocarpus tenellus]
MSATLVPGPGTYDVCENSAGTHGFIVGTQFSRTGARPKVGQAKINRLTFDEEKEHCRGDRPGPGTYEVLDLLAPGTPRWNVFPPVGQEGAPRFPALEQAGMPGPGDYISATFASKGPVALLTGRPAEPPNTINSPGPGDYTSMSLSQQVDEVVPGGFGCMTSPRFPAGDLATPGPASYQSPRFEPSGKNFTFRHLTTSPGLASRVRDITRFSWEDDDRMKELYHGGSSSHHRGCKPHLPRQQRHQRHATSAPPSLRLLRACARGCGKGWQHQLHLARSLVEAASTGMQRKSRHPSIKATAAFGTAHRIPTEVQRAPGPGSYQPPTLDEAIRTNRVVGIGTFGMAKRFSPCNRHPGPGEYNVELASTATKPSVARPLSFTGRPRVAYDPRLNHFFSSIYMNRAAAAPSAHTYKPGVESSCHAPPSWSFTSKIHIPSAPVGPGPGQYISPHYTRKGPVHSFRGGRRVTPSAVSHILWDIPGEPGAGEGGGGALDRFYNPLRTSRGARINMTSRCIPRCGRRR